MHLFHHFCRFFYTSLVEEFILPLNTSTYTMTSLSLEKCVPLKCSFSTGNKYKLEGARSGEYGG